ncbi:oligosaccharide flippase family protein [Patescibacteria group bacterium]|nr:oligosaccharide flippase family protein [Patescibacteria group bacterium]
MDDFAAEEHLDPTTEINLATIKKRAVSGVVALTGRMIILQVLSLVATFLLTVFLTPTQFGVFYVVSAAVSFFAYFSDIGLGAALIQKKEGLTRKELATTFTVQNGLVLIILLIIFLATPLYQKWYHLDQAAIYLLWALGFSLLLSSLKSIPSLLLERELNFNKLIVPQIAESLVYQFVVVFLAWRGFGINSFTIAVLLRGFTGLGLMYLMKPWRPSLALAIDSLRGLLRFGLPYQINTFLAVAKDDGMILVLGGILGSANIGLLGWAQKWAAAPLRFFMDQVIKVTFPAYSRMQEHEEELSKAINKSLLFICILVFPALVTLCIAAPSLVLLIPKYTKWQPALVALSLISLNSAWAAVTTPLTNVLNAIGKIKTTFKLMVMWTVLSWLFIPSLSYFYGVNGAALGYTLVGMSSIVAILIVLRFVKLDLFVSVGKPLLSAVIMGSVMVTLQRLMPLSWVNLVMMFVVGITVYVLLNYLLLRSVIQQDISKVLTSFKGAKGV